LAHHNFFEKKKEKAPQNKSFYGGQWSALIWPKYIGEKGGFSGKTYAIKMENMPIFARQTF